MNNNDSRPATLELSTIEPITLDQRHGRARDLFTIWFGSNIMLLTVDTGALAVTVFKLPFAATNAMSLYYGTLSAITVGQTLIPKWPAGALSRAVTALVLFSISLTLALLGQDDFMANYTNFILLLLYVLVQIPFMATELYTGVIAHAMGGADISWIVGLVVISPIYYLASRRCARRQSVSPVRRNA
jgi:NCS1 family nucleobase:cation symporter-1